MSLTPLRTAATTGLALSLLLSWTGPGRAERTLSVQEAILRAKPAVALVVAEVVAEVRLNCGSGEIQHTPPPFRETGTGWFIDARGFIITNGHVVQPAHTPPRWMVNSFAKRAIESACVPAILKRMGIAPGERPVAEDQVKRQALDSVLPSTKVKLDPGIFVVLSNGTRVRAEVKKYSPPLSVGDDPEGKMSGRDLALLKIPGKDFPILPLADSKAAKIGDPIHILGFPGVVLSHELLNQSATVEASVTNGAVSGFKQDKANQPVIQTDAPAAWGNSGGPAVTARGEMVGVLTFVSLAPGPEGGIVQGFNFIIPSNAVRDFRARGRVRRQLQGRRAVLQRGEQARPQPPRRQADARGGPGQDQEPAAAAVPLGVGHTRRHAHEPRQLWRHVGAQVAEESLPRGPLRGHPSPGGGQESPGPRREEAVRLRDEPPQGPRGPVRLPRRPRRGQVRHRGRAQPHRHRLLHLTRRSHERQDGAKAQADGLQGCQDPEGWPRGLGQRGPSARGQSRPADDRRRALQEHARDGRHLRPDRPVPPTSGAPYGGKQPPKPRAKRVGRLCRGASEGAGTRASTPKAWGGLGGPPPRNQTSRCRIRDDVKSTAMTSAIRTSSTAEAAG
ncbi:MAG: trypsin-like peptidase domain-containing protein [Candidatus Rokubacteria bacterium]|nr:trypsin-like peptidase domain-containing protein [Candidatus Rokubacteria bacterium]